MIDPINAAAISGAGIVWLWLSRRLDACSKRERALMRELERVGRRVARLEALQGIPPEDDEQPAKREGSGSLFPI